MAKKSVKTNEAKAKSSAAPPSPPTTIIKLTEAPDTGSVMSKAIEAAGTASLLTVKDAASNQLAASLLVDLKRAEKQVKEAKDFLVGPLKKHVKDIEARFKPTLEALANADMALRSKVITYRQQEEAKVEKARQEALTKALAAQEKGQHAKATALATEAVALTGPAKQTMAEDGALQAKKRWTFEVTDFKLVPREYLTVDDREVNTAIRAGVRDVPGLRIFQKDELAVSTD